MVRFILKTYLDKTREVNIVSLEINKRNFYKIEDNQSTELSNVYFISGSIALDVFDEQTIKEETTDDAKAQV